jgi:hypothetical protein
MRLTSDQLRALYQRRTARTAGDRLACPDAATLSRAAAGDADAGDRGQLVGHLAECSSCAEEYRAALTIKAWAEQTAGEAGIGTRPASGEPGSASARSASVRRTRGRSLAAAAVIALAAGVVLWQVLSDPLPVSDRGEPALTPLVTAVEPTHLQQLPEAPVRLRWSASVSADAYRVLVLDAESTRIWDSGAIVSTTVDLPGDVRDRLARGQPVYWQVTVVSGVDERQSRVFQFSISP